MEFTTSRKVILGIGATIVLGAVGSGVWELVFSPTVSWLGRGLLTLATLGLESVSDSIYVDVAKGHHERSSLAIYGLVSIGFLFAPLVLARRPLLIPKIRQFLEGKDPEQLEAMRKKNVRLLSHLLLILTLLGTVIFVRSLMHTYTNTAITYFNQSLNIVLPFISVEEERRFRSEFARISSKNDYVQLVNKLNERAKSNGIQLPKFSIW